LTAGYVSNIIFEYAGGLLAEIGTACSFLVMLFVLIVGVVLMLVGWKGTEYSEL